MSPQSGLQRKPSAVGLLGSVVSPNANAKPAEAPIWAKDVSGAPAPAAAAPAASDDWGAFASTPQVVSSVYRLLVAGGGGCNAFF